jgi:hypothetical protein
MSRGISDSFIRVQCGHGLDRIGGMGSDKHCEPNEAGAGGEGMSEEEIDYNLMGTFPASDPPSWTLGIRRDKSSCDEFEGEKPSPHDPSHQNEPLD